MIACLRYVFDRTTVNALEPNRIRSRQWIYFAISYIEEREKTHPQTGLTTQQDILEGRQKESKARGMRKRDLRRNKIRPSSGENRRFWVNFIIPPPIGELSIVMSVSACLCVFFSVREHIFRTTRPIFTNFFVHVTYGRGSVLLWGFGGVIICYVFPVLRMTSYLLINQGCSMSPTR